MSCSQYATSVLIYFNFGSCINCKAREMSY
uniref:Uncharacterized protein n=1 Tax=Anguilla anguilla TaxID=7936 RepID=A0A0E9W986_ANGAN